MRFYLYWDGSFIWLDWFSQTSMPLDLVKAPQQIKATLRRLEQVQGPGQNTATLSCKKLSTASLYGGTMLDFSLCRSLQCSFYGFLLPLCHMHIFIMNLYTSQVNVWFTDLQLVTYSNLKLKKGGNRHITSFIWKWSLKIVFFFFKWQFYLACIIYCNHKIRPYAVQCFLAQASWWALPSQCSWTLQFDILFHAS